MAKILIVEDSKTTRMVLRSILETEGHEIVGEATNGLEGFDMYMSLKPDMVTMDLNMPLVDGIACAERIKKKDPGAKILLISANVQAQLMVDAAALGLNYHVPKPISEKMLKNTVKCILEGEKPEENE
ncbi:MAG: response regulator [Clostridiales bacterium]|jgi:two-component system chemotaxis response regulator CheY|nr:response regulator [Clostridiales bacterium]